MSAETHVDMSRLYRAHIQPRDWRGTELTAFVEASSEHAARRKIAAAVAGLEYDTASEVEERIYNLKSAKECIADGVSPELELRLFEIGWSSEAVTFVQQPLFLLRKPAAIARKWAQIPVGGTP